MPLHSRDEVEPKSLCSRFAPMGRWLRLLAGRQQTGHGMTSEDESESLSKNDLLRLSADIIGSYVGRNVVPVTGLQSLIGEIYGALSRLERPGAAEVVPAVRARPAVPIGRSIQQDHLVCLEDGKKLKMLKRYLRAQFDLSPEEYRRKWGLPPDYPMVAPAYAERRSAFAKQIGLGRGVRRRTN
jgi:predicted transcriptional regulator